MQRNDHEVLGTMLVVSFPLVHDPMLRQGWLVLPTYTCLFQTTSAFSAPGANEKLCTEEKSRHAHRAEILFFFLNQRYALKNHLIGDKKGSS